MDQRRDSAVSPARVTGWSVLLMLTAVAIVSAVRLLPTGLIGTFAGIAAGVILTPLVASPCEWVVHRYVYHRRGIPAIRRIYTVHQAHHHLYFPTWRYVTGGPARRIPLFRSDVSKPLTSAWGNALTRTAHFSFYMVLGVLVICTPAWLATRNVPFLIGVVLALIVISNLFVTVHDAIHRPGSHPDVERQPWFQFLDEHHYIHHVDNDANVNFLLPLANWLFGTLRRSLTEEEVRKHGSRERAKNRITGSGVPAKLVAVPDEPATDPQMPFSTLRLGDSG